MSIVHKNRHDLAPDAVEMAIFGVSGKVFTLVMSGAEKTAWVEIVDGDDKILITYPIDEVANLIFSCVTAERDRRSQMEKQS